MKKILKQYLYAPVDCQTNWHHLFKQTQKYLNFNCLMYSAKIPPFSGNTLPKYRDKKSVSVFHEVMTKN